MPATSSSRKVKPNAQQRPIKPNSKHAVPNWKPVRPKFLPMLWPAKRNWRDKLSLAQKAGVDGRLFGSVTNADIASAIVATGIKAEKANVRLPEGPFKAIGEYEVEIALHSDAVAKVTVAVVAAAE